MKASCVCRFVVSSVVVVGLCGAGLSSASAQEKKAKADEDVQHQVSITISPVLLALPIVELTGEYRVTDEIGVAAILGGGAFKGERLSDDPLIADGDFTAIEAGAQGRYYAVGNFIHGMQLGVEVLYLSISGENLGGASLSGSGQGLSAGGFIGYKIATNIGFTFDAQLGYSALLVSAEASDGDETAKKSDNSGGPLLNLNIGWSF